MVSEEDRRKLAEARLEEHVKKVVDAAPPLSQEQKLRLAQILSQR